MNFLKICLFFLILILILIHNSIFSQINRFDLDTKSDDLYIEDNQKLPTITKLNINITTGYSDISGFVGVNIDIKNFGIDLGISTIFWEENNELNKKWVFGGGASYYFKGFDYEKYATFHPYISAGYSFNSSYYTLISYLYPTPQYDLIWSDKLSLICGFVVNSNYSRFSSKIGLGYQMSNNSPLAIEFTFRYRIFTKIID